MWYGREELLVEGMFLYRMFFPVDTYFHSVLSILLGISISSFYVSRTKLHGSPSPPTEGGLRVFPSVHKVVAGIMLIC